MASIASGAAAGSGSRAALWAGYAAFAWGAFFAVQHLYWFLSGRFDLEQTGARSAQAPTYVFAGVFSVLLFGLLAFFPLVLVWPVRRMGQRRLQIALLLVSHVAMVSLNLSSLLFSWSGSACTRSVSASSAVSSRSCVHAARASRAGWSWLPPGHSAWG